MDEQTPKPKGKHGGSRPGAGRKAGLRNGEVSAVRVTGLRVPKDASPEAAALADEAFDTIVSVMRKPKRGAGYQLSAATAVREEICGAIKKTTKVEGTGEDGALEVIVKTVAE